MPKELHNIEPTPLEKSKCDSHLNYIKIIQRLSTAEIKSLHGLERASDATYQGTPKQTTIATLFEYDTKCVRLFGYKPYTPREMLSLIDKSAVYPEEKEKSFKRKG